ncbi:MAG TPA: precorrin-8X methylmutase [Methanoregulaceae archaeon]|nr:precorrin-8X methylmutase [Methanoregulaceae archaeon]
MSRESLHNGATTGNTYTDLGATTKEAYEISARSRTLARETIGNEGYEDRVRQRCSIAVGDFAMADLIRFDSDPVVAGLRALSDGAPIITDIRMVQVGIQKKGHHSAIICALDFDQGAAEQGITRTSRGFINLGPRINGAIVVIGNAPSSLITVCHGIRGGFHPALVVGTPVGFVNAKESKELLREIAVPSISTEGTRGGTPVAVAAINEIITIHAELADVRP